MVKARINKNADCICDSCGKDRDNVLDMYDILFVHPKTSHKIKLTLCDECNEELLNKTLKCSCYTNHRTKSQKDLKVSNARNIRRHKN